MIVGKKKRRSKTDKGRFVVRVLAAERHDMILFFEVRDTNGEFEVEIEHLSL